MRGDKLTVGAWPANREANWRAQAIKLQADLDAVKKSCPAPVSPPLPQPIKMK
jgi:hypothetical protein